MVNLTRDKLLPFLLKAVGWCFLLEAFGLTIALTFTVWGAVLLGMGPFLELTHSPQLGMFTILWGWVSFCVAFIGYYLLAYAFLRLQWWGVPLAFSLNTLFLAKELWRFLFPWELNQQKAHVLLETLSARMQDQFTEQVFEEAWQLSNQTATLLDLLGRTALVLLLFILTERPELRTLMK